MIKEWKNKKIKEIGKVVSGGTPSTKIKEYWNGNIAWITPKDLSTHNSVFISKGSRNITLEGLNKSSAKLIPKNSILFSSRAPIGYVAIAKNDLATNQGFKNIIVNEKNDPMFVYYLLLYETPNIKKISSGSTFSEISGKQFANFEVKVPSLQTQKHISSILSLFDKKIEINNKINEKLETLAQTLYKHWFVDFEFPNEEGLPYKSSGGKMVETELGIIPEGWTYEKLGNSKITKLLSSGIKKFSNEKIYLATADVSNYTITNNSTKITYLKRPSRANMQPGSNTLWFAKMKDSKKLVRVSNKSTDIINNYIFSTGFAGLSVEKYLNYVWSFLLSKEFNELKDSLANGTTQQAINNKNINLINLLIPSENILEKFELLTQNIFDMIEKNWMENQKLANLRDLLLPKLMSGEIRVPIEEE